jgi:hypothetical protein
LSVGNRVGVGLGALLAGYLSVAGIGAHDMTSATSNRIVSSLRLAAPPLRLSVQPPAHRRRVLDGGWWPRSQDPRAELPSLITALNASRDVVTQVLLNMDAWSPRPHRLNIDRRTVRIGWVQTLDPHLIVAICGNGDRLNLLVVPPRTNMTSAAAALAAAADGGNTLRASEVLLRLSIPLLSSGTAERLSESVWETDGGRVFETSESGSPAVGRTTW